MTTIFPRLKGRWFDDVRIEGSRRKDALDRERLRDRFLSAEAPDLRGVKDLAKTAFERQAVTAASAAVNAIRRSLDLPDDPIDERRVHVLSPGEFARRFPSNDAIGITHLGRIYLIRNDQDPVTFVATLTHEAAHAASFSSLRVAVIPETEGLPAIDVRQDRSGLAVLHVDKTRFDYEGFNEGVTEMVAAVMRRLIASRTTLLRPDDGAILAECIGHKGHVALIEDLGRQLEDRAPDWRRTLFRDYFTGTSDFLRECRRTLPGTDVLCDARPTIDGALECAATIGLLGACVRIENLVREARRSA